MGANGEPDMMGAYLWSGVAVLAPVVADLQTRIRLREDHAQGGPASVKYRTLGSDSLDPIPKAFFFRFIFLWLTRYRISTVEFHSTGFGISYDL